MGVARRLWQKVQQLGGTRRGMIGLVADNVRAEALRSSMECPGKAFWYSIQINLNTELAARIQIVYRRYSNWYYIVNQSVARSIVSKLFILSRLVLPAYPLPRQLLDHGK